MEWSKQGQQRLPLTTKRLHEKYLKSIEQHVDVDARGDRALDEAQNSAAVWAGLDFENGSIRREGRHAWGKGD